MVGRWEGGGAGLGRSAGPAMIKDNQIHPINLEGGSGDAGEEGVLMLMSEKAVEKKRVHPTNHEPRKQNPSNPGGGGTGVMSPPNQPESDIFQCIQPMR